MRFRQPGDLLRAIAETHAPETAFLKGNKGLDHMITVPETVFPGIKEREKALPPVIDLIYQKIKHGYAEYKKRQNIQNRKPGHEKDHDAHQHQVNSCTEIRLHHNEYKKGGNNKHGYEKLDDMIVFLFR